MASVVLRRERGSAVAAEESERPKNFEPNRIRRLARKRGRRKFNIERGSGVLLKEDRNPDRNWGNGRTVRMAGMSYIFFRVEGGKGQHYLCTKSWQEGKKKGCEKSNTMLPKPDVEKKYSLEPTKIEGARKRVEFG